MNAKYVYFLLFTYAFTSCNSEQKELTEVNIAASTTSTNLKYAEGFIIEPEMTVHDLEEAFWGNMGIQTAVFRKVGSSMLETTFTSGWTLEHQNNKGQELKTAFGA